MMEDACFRCRYAVRLPPTVHGPGELNCRRMPPVMVVVPMTNARGQQTSGVELRVASPSVPDMFWCGEFKEKSTIFTVKNDYVEKA